MSENRGIIPMVEYAVINSEPDEVREIFKRYGSCRVSNFGAVCRFRGPEMVKVLCENVPQTGEFNEPRLLDTINGGAVFWMLNISEESPVGRKFIRLPQNIKRADGKVLEQIPDSERAEVLKYLCENGKSTVLNRPSCCIFRFSLMMSLFSANLKSLA